MLDTIQLMHYIMKHDTIMCEYTSYVILHIMLQLFFKCEQSLLYAKSDM